MSSTSETTFNVHSYINNLSEDEKKEFLKQLGKEMDTTEISIIKKSNQDKRKQERLSKSLQKYRKSWKILRCKEEDLGCDWVNNWWKNNRITDKNLIEKGYQDIILGYDTKQWSAITGTDCEWFEPQGFLQDMINAVRYHNRSGVGEWGAATIGGSHEHVTRVFIGSDSVKYFEGDGELEILKNRYKQVYILDYNKPFST